MKLYPVLANAPVGDRAGEHILISFLVLNLRLWEEGRMKGTCLGLGKNSGWRWEPALELQIPQLSNGTTVSKARHGGLCLQPQHLVG